MRGSASDGVQIGVGDGHEGGVTKDLQPSQLAKVDRLEWLQVHLIVLVRSLLGGRIDALELQ